MGDIFSDISPETRAVIFGFVIATIGQVLAQFSLFRNAQAERKHAAAIQTEELKFKENEAKSELLETRRKEKIDFLINTVNKLTELRGIYSASVNTSQETNRRNIAHGEMLGILIRG